MSPFKPNYSTWLIANEPAEQKSEAGEAARESTVPAEKKLDSMFVREDSWDFNDVVEKRSIFLQRANRSAQRLWRQARMVLSDSWGDFSTAYTLDGPGYDKCQLCYNKSYGLVLSCGHRRYL